MAASSCCSLRNGIDFEAFDSPSWARILDAAPTFELVWEIGYDERHSEQRNVLQLRGNTSPTELRLPKVKRNVLYS